MAFNSYLYLVVFLPFCVLFYYACPKKARWLILLGFSIAYYYLCSRKTTLLLLITALWVFLTAWILGKIHACGKKRLALAAAGEKRAIKARALHQKRLILALALFVLFGLLIVLKYYGFFSANVGRLIPGLLPPLKLAIPLGISFYTLQAAGYLIDVYRGKYEPCKNPLHLVLFLSFFPQIVEGPIGRYDRLAPQLLAGHAFDSDHIIAGLRHIAWGLFLKMVIADRAAMAVNTVFDNYTGYSGITVIFAILLYTLQLYGEFMGCMEIACGSACLMGIRLDANFRQPFGAQSINEFWQRWHITLGSWIRDYIFYPISMSAAMKKLGKRLPAWLPTHYKKSIPVYTALFFVWLFNGLWHGSSWHYIFYGLYYYGCMTLGMLLEPLFARMRPEPGSPRAPGMRAFRSLRTFLLVNVGMLIFRANGLQAAAHMFLSIFTGFKLSFASAGELLSLGCDWQDLMILGAGVLILTILGYLRERGFTVCGLLACCPRPLCWAIYYGLFFAVLIFGAYGKGYSPVDFIYAQF